MKLKSLLPGTLVFLVLCLHVAQPGFRNILQKPGYCPNSWFVCPAFLLPKCWIDSNCKENKKCCFYHCKQQCVMPVSGQDPGQDQDQETDHAEEPEEEEYVPEIFYDSTVREMPTHPRT